jgi:hypothetical protein
MKNDRDIDSLIIAGEPRHQQSWIEQPVTGAAC